MKTSTLAFVYVFSAFIVFLISKTLYLNGMVDHWFPLWLDCMIVVSIGGLCAVLYTHSRKRRGASLDRQEGTSRNPATYGMTQ